MTLISTKPIAPLLFCLVLVGALFPLSMVRAEFVDGFPDTPLMPGLSVVEGSRVEFNTTRGRILQVRLEGDASPADFWTYMRTTMAPLGWSELPDVRSFYREGEVLMVAVEAHGTPDQQQPIIVDLLLTPRLE